MHSLIVRLWLDPSADSKIGSKTRFSYALCRHTKKCLYMFHSSNASSLPSCNTKQACSIKQHACVQKLAESTTRKAYTIDDTANIPEPERCIHVKRSFGGTNGEPPSEARQLRKGGPGVLPRKISKTYIANGAIYVIPELYL